MASFVLHCHFVSIPHSSPLPCSIPWLRLRCCLAPKILPLPTVLQNANNGSAVATPAAASASCGIKLQTKTVDWQHTHQKHTHTHTAHTQAHLHTQLWQQNAPQRPEPAVRYEGCSHWKVFLAFNCAGKMKMEWKMEMLCGCPALPYPTLPCRALLHCCPADIRIGNLSAIQRVYTENSKKFTNILFVIFFLYFY